MKNSIGYSYHKKDGFEYFPNSKFKNYRFTNLKCGIVRIFGPASSDKRSFIKFEFFKFINFLREKDVTFVMPQIQLRNGKKAYFPILKNVRSNMDIEIAFFSLSIHGGIVDFSIIDSSLIEVFYNTRNDDFFSLLDEYVTREYYGW